MRSVIQVGISERVLLRFCPKQGLYIDRRLFNFITESPSPSWPIVTSYRGSSPQFEGVIPVSRGYDGPEIDDFRNPGWGQEPERSSRDWNRGRDNGWQTRAGVQVKLQRLREAESRSDQLLSETREHRHSGSSTLSPDNRQPARLQEHNREKYVDRGRTYSLRPSEIRVLTEVGKFRVIGVDDVAKFIYASDRARMESDLRSLGRQGLVEQRGTSVLKKQSRQVLRLTKQGQHLTRRHGFVSEDQAIYSGLVKPKEVDHDADLYRMYHKAAVEIERKGGRILQVQLDYELKEKLYQRLGRDQARDGGETQRLKAAFARDLRLPVVRGKVTFPDLRIEYATPEMEIARMDLELATRHYHAGHLAEKARAGFQLYARSEDTAGLRRVRDEKEITVAILSL